jgi:hypothetical protein
MNVTALTETRDYNKARAASCKRAPRIRQNLFFCAQENSIACLNIEPKPPFRAQAAPALNATR